MHQGRRLVGAVGHRPHPLELQVVHVVPVDLVERAITLRIVGPPVDEPIPRVGIDEFLFRNRLEVGDLVESLGHTSGLGPLNRSAPPSPAAGSPTPSSTAPGTGRGRAGEHRPHGRFPICLNHSTVPLHTVRPEQVDRDGIVDGVAQ